MLLIFFNLNGNTIEIASDPEPEKEFFSVPGNGKWINFVFQTNL